MSNILDERYPKEWKHCTIHLNPETGIMHSDGDHNVRHWIEGEIKRLTAEDSLKEAVISAAREIRNCQAAPRFAADRRLWDAIEALDTVSGRRCSLCGSEDYPHICQKAIDVLTAAADSRLPTEREQDVTILGFPFKVIAGAPDDCIMFIHKGNLVGRIEFDLAAAEKATDA